VPTETTSVELAIVEFSDAPAILIYVISEAAAPTVAVSVFEPVAIYPA